MLPRSLLVAATLLLLSAPGRAQTPLLPSGPGMPPPPPQTIPAPQDLAPLPPAPPSAPTSPYDAPGAPLPPFAGPGPGGSGGLPPPPAAPAPPMPAAPPVARVFCDQNVTFTLAPRDSVPATYRAFLGIFSDAAWTPTLCAALVVENVSPDGIATIVYAFGPMGTGTGGTGGVLNGTGIIRGGELKFQNSDGSQYSFRPFYSDLEGHMLTPQGQAFEAIFKRSF